MKFTGSVQKNKRTPLHKSGLTSIEEKRRNKDVKFLRPHKKMKLVNEHKHFINVPE